MKKNHLISLSNNKRTTIKMFVMNCCCWILLLYVGSILTACSDEDSVKKNPYLSTCTRAMLKEAVEVRFLNLDKNTNIHIDFGDGTIKEGMSTDVITHKYTQSGDYTMNVTAGEHKIQKRIRVYNLLALTEAMKQFKDPNYKKVWVMTHRAHTTDLTIPENSIPSVSAAIKSGAEIIECDTHVTKDGVVVVCHDQTLNATTNGSGDITKMTFEEIQKYNLKDRNGNLTDEKRKEVIQLLQKYGLEEFKDKYPKSLSGGMRQRVALIRTLATNPDILLLDEPFSSLDYISRLKLSDDIYQIIKEEGKTAIIVTHDIQEAISLINMTINTSYFIRCFHYIKYYKK